MHILFEKIVANRFKLWGVHILGLRADALPAKTISSLNTSFPDINKKNLMQRHQSIRKN